MLFPMIVAVKVVASSASIIVHYIHVHVASQNTLEISLGHEYKIVNWLYLYKVSTILSLNGSKLRTSFV